MAKFLSFIESLPYYKIVPTQTDFYKEMIKEKSNDKPSLDLKNMIRRAVENQKLIITLPWIIEYCSMLDLISMKMTYFEEIFKDLIHIYRFVLSRKNFDFHQIKEPENVLDADPEESHSPMKKVHSVINEGPLISDFNAFFLCISLGWLFENPSFPRELFIEEANSNFLQEYVNFTKSTSNLDGNRNLNMNMNLNLLYNCCPYVSELKVILCQFHTGFKASKVTKRLAPKDLNKIVKTSTPSQGIFILTISNLFECSAYGGAAYKSFFFFNFKLRIEI